MTYNAPHLIVPIAPMISSLGEYAVGLEARFRNIGAAASGTWAAARYISYVPCWVPQTVTVQKMWWLNGVTLSGNVDCGIYASASGLPSGLLISTGTVAQAAPSSAVQSFSVTNINLAPDLYFLAMSMDNTTGTVFRVAPNLPILQELGCVQQTPAGFGLPSSATAISQTQTSLPVFGFSTVSTI